MTVSRTGGMEWAVAERAAHGGVVSGDFACVREVGDAVVLVVVDVLGHGAGAAEAAGRFRDLLDIAPVSDLSGLFRGCDQRLKGDRGAVMTAARVTSATRALTWLGVGNVQAVIVRGRGTGEREWLLVRSGVLGSGLAPLDARSATLGRDDVLVLATDGIHAAYATAVNPLDPVDRIAQAVLEAHGRSDDDALVLAARIGS